MTGKSLPFCIQYSTVMTGALHEVLTHRGEYVEQYPLFDADAAVFNAVLLQERIALRDGMGLAVNGKGELPLYHVGDLRMGMAVQRPLCAGFKAVFDAHQVICIRKDAPGNAVIRLGLGLIMKDPALLFVYHTPPITVCGSGSRRRH